MMRRAAKSFVGLIPLARPGRYAKAGTFVRWTPGLNWPPRKYMSLAYVNEVTSVRQASPAPRQVRLFRNNRNQAIRIPVEFELPGNEAIISRDGDRLIIEPVRAKGLAALLDSWTPLDEEIPEMDDPQPAPRDIF
jgi:antitoxin VapB